MYPSLLAVGPTQLHLNPTPHPHPQTPTQPNPQISGLLADTGKLTDILKYHVVKLFVKDKEHIRSFRLSNKVSVSRLCSPPTGVQSPSTELMNK